MAAISFYQRLHMFREAYEKAVRGEDLSYAVYSMLHDGRELAGLVLREKEIPKAKLRAFEKAYKTFTRQTRVKDRAAWWAKNRADAALLLESVSWPPKGAGTKVGGFTVTNQTDKDPAAVINTIQTASDALARSEIPQARSVLYGDVYLVGAIERKKTIMARYDPERDQIFVLMLPKFSAEQERTLIHEIGHRYWKKIMTPTQKREWNLHHSRIVRSVSPYDIPLPKVGDVLTGYTGEPVVTEIDYAHDRIKVSATEGVGFAAYRGREVRQKIRELLPTAYSETNAEEHFCESFSLYALARLPSPHREAFEAVVGTTKAAANPSRNFGRLLNPW